jgi:hypothetical protein
MTLRPELQRNAMRRHGANKRKGFDLIRDGLTPSVEPFAILDVSQAINSGWTSSH